MLLGSFPKPLLKGFIRILCVDADLTANQSDRYLCRLDKGLYLDDLVAPQIADRVTTFQSSSGQVRGSSVGKLFFPLFPNPTGSAQTALQDFIVGVMFRSLDHHGALGIHLDEEGCLSSGCPDHGARDALIAIGQQDALQFLRSRSMRTICRSCSKMSLAFSSPKRLNRSGNKALRTEVSTPPGFREFSAKAFSMTVSIW